MKSHIIKRLISTGVTPELSDDEIKRVKLTNGGALISVLCATVAVFTDIFAEFIVTGNIPQSTLITFVVEILADLITLSVIYLNYKKQYFTARVTIMFIWWIMFTSLCVMYGKEIRIDHYFIGIMLLPAGLFSRRRQVYIGIAVTALLYIGINIYYHFHQPLLESNERFTFYSYLIHITVSTAGIIILSLYYRYQNENNETKLSKEVTKHKETSMQLQHANADKDKFFSIIAHDLKGPIGNIANILDVIDIKTIKPELLFYLQSSANNTFELTQDLLTWARAQKGQIELQPANFNIFEQFKYILAPLKHSAQQKNIQIQAPDEGKELFVFADIPTIKTVMRNLVSNAIKFTKTGGVIKLLAYPENDKVKIVVSDTGVGMSVDKLSQLFKIGSKITSPGTMNERGTGLGLLLCKEFVELNNGEIMVESEENKGSVFWFTLPVGEPVDLKVIQESFKEMKLKTLIVEDNYLNLENTITVITKANIGYDVANNGKEAIEKGTETIYDFILMDIDLPEKNGIEANKAIREKYADAVIIALSSYNKTEILQKDMYVRFDDFLKKPLNFDNLIFTLKKLIIDK